MIRRYVYFIKPVNMDGPIKIGCSNVPSRRLVELASWSPWPLEIIGVVPGTQKDEIFLHKCFADLHSHHEWFLPNPSLRSTIEKMLAAGSMEPARGLVPKANGIRPTRPPRSEDRLRYFSYNMKVIWACKKLRVERADEVVYATAPEDVRGIMDRWSGNPYRGIAGVPPTAAEMAVIEEFLAAPALHGILHQSKRIPKPERAA